MNEKMQAAIKDHAIEQFPRESCGVIVIHKGKEVYLPCRNIADSATEHFAIDPHDYIAAEEIGEIVGIVHSHPNVPARPSEADKVMCEASGLPWYIVNVQRSDAGNLHTSEVFRFEPTGYKAPLIGRPFHHGVLDCYSLVKDWYAENYGVALPHFERRDNWWNNGQKLYLDNYERAGFEPIKGAIQFGDVILMQIRSPTPNHAAVYIGDGQIVHHQAGRLSSRDVYAGYFQDCTIKVIRYKDGINV